MGTGDDMSGAATPRLYRVILPVAAIDEATRFYAAVLGIDGKRVSPGRHYFDCRGTILACFDPRADGDNFDATPNPDHIYVAVSNLEQTFERARRAGCTRIDQEIKTQPWGERMFYAADPWGNPIAFVDERTVFSG
jgi:predicted enzyme related to lactoylglutathione lyase